MEGHHPEASWSMHSAMVFLLSAKGSEEEAAGPGVAVALSLLALLRPRGFGKRSRLSAEKGPLHQ